MAATRRSEGDLFAMLDAPRSWVVRGSHIAMRPTLNLALRYAHQISMNGGAPSSIALLPNDEIVIEADQIVALWKRLGLVDEQGRG